ncbi:MAG: hypothetical protein IIY03_00410, partial [Muribaculaceae bacterium]|nr:hypothetical protein [Muribaculaceae bacterium]
SEGTVYYLSPLGSDAEIIYTDGEIYTNVTFTLTIDEEEMATILMTGTVGIEGIEAEQEAEYFNLQGIRVSNPTKGELYIVRKGNKIIKSILK